MILTTCAACAKPLEHDAPARCVGCQTRYCSDRCLRYHAHRGGHDDECEEIANGGGAEQHHANKKYGEAVAEAVEECAEDTEGQTCFICMDGEAEEGLVRGCACRGENGFAHVSCLARGAQVAVERGAQNGWVRWHTCGLCEQEYHGVVRCALGWACWKTYVGRPERKSLRRGAMSQLGNGLYHAKRLEDALAVQEAQLSMERRLGVAEENIIAVQGNVACVYAMLERREEAMCVRKDVYSGWLKLLGEEHQYTFIAADNYALSLLDLRRFEEAKSLMRKTLPVARRVLGESHDLTIRMVRSYAIALFRSNDATLDNLREAVETLAETERTARRVLGGAHPVTEGIEGDLKNARAWLRAHEGAVESLSEAVAEMMPGDAQDELLAPTA